MIAAIGAQARPEPIGNELIPEDKLWCKALTCIPMVGIVASVYFETLIAFRINHRNVDNLNRVIQLIELKNQFKKCAIISSVVGAILWIAAAKSGIIPAYYVIQPIVVLIVNAGYNIYMIYKNNQLLNEIEDPNREFRGGLRVY